MPRILRFTTLLVVLAASPLALADPAGDPASGGQDFIAEARLLYRAVACGTGDRPAPAGQDAGVASVVASHCKEQTRRIAKFRKSYITRAEPFFATLIPAGLPGSVVYPFGGGDLLAALVTYPGATEYTTISLEHAGDPRRLGKLDSTALQQSLAYFREASALYVKNNDHRSENLRKLERGAIPGQLAFFLMALAVYDYEPVALRYFRIEDDGSLHYYSSDEIAKLDDTVAQKKSRRWVDTDHSIAFSNMELSFRKRGQPGAPVRIHRHIAGNLDDEHFSGSGLQKHLASKGKIAAMTKAASYLLWSSSFSAIRTYLLDNMVFMVSDSTGVPPRLARAAGFEQKTYGSYAGAFFEENRESRPDQDFVALWQAQPRRRLPFRYGYVDSVNNPHLLVTLPRTATGKTTTGKATTSQTATP